MAMRVTIRKIPGSSYLVTIEDGSTLVSARTDLTTPEAVFAALVQPIQEVMSDDTRVTITVA